MTAQHSYGHTKRGEVLTDEMIERFAEEAERGYEPGQLTGRRRGPGRPPLGDAAKSVESVRLEPELRDEVARRAQTEGVTVSELIRRALRQYLKSAWRRRSRRATRSRSGSRLSAGCLKRERAKTSYSRKLWIPDLTKDATYLPR